MANIAQAIDLHPPTMAARPDTPRPERPSLTASDGDGDQKSASTEMKKMAEASDMMILDGRPLLLTPPTTDDALKQTHDNFDHTIAAAEDPALVNSPPGTVGSTVLFPSQEPTSPDDATVSDVASEPSSAHQSPARRPSSATSVFSSKDDVASPTTPTTPTTVTKSRWHSDDPYRLQWQDLDQFLEAHDPHSHAPPLEPRHPRFRYHLPDKKIPEDKRIVEGEELKRRALHFLTYHIPSAEPEYGWQVADVRQSCTREPWFWVKQLAWEGRLFAFESGTDDVLEEAKRMSHGLKGAAPRSPPAQAPVKSRHHKATTKAPKAKSHETPVHTPRRRVEREPVARATTPAGPTKRKGREDDQAAAVAKPEKKIRQSFNPNGTKGFSESERFGKAIKHVFNARSASNSDYAPFNDAILPAVDAASDLARYTAETGFHSTIADYGDPKGLREQELQLCHKLNITYDMYRCQKNRIFLGLALYVEQNVRALAHPDAKIWNVGKAQAQYFGNIDANKLSHMWKAFELWGWVREDLGVVDGRTEDGKKRLRVCQEYLDLFPPEHRKHLMDEYIAWENANVNDSSNWVARRL